MKLDGFDTFSKLMKTIEQEAPGAMGKFMKNQGEVLKAETQEGTPVDTGMLKITWQREDEGLKQTILNLTNYGAHVEYGHRTGKRKKKFVKGRFMLRKAVDSRRIRFYKDLESFTKGLVGR